MTTLAPSRASAPLNPDEIRRIVALGKARGLIRSPGGITPIAKVGAPVAAEAGLRSLWMDIDPDTAAKWLKNNLRNRPISQDVVIAYARDMANGTWAATHQGIAFNDGDALIDGQHRLTAIVRSNKIIRMMVTFGLPSEIAGAEMTTMDAVDRGRTRSVADQLKIQHGMKDGSIVAAVAMSLAGLCFGERTRRLSVGQTLDVFRAFQASAVWMIEHRVKDHGLKTAGVLAAFAFAMATDKAPAKGAAGEIQSMYERLVGGKAAELPERTPMKVLRAFLTSDEAKLLTRGTDRGVAELVLNAILLEQMNKRVDVLTLIPAGADHFRALQPERVAKIAAMFRLPANT